MEMVTLGKTGITVNKNGFGALPIQRISTDDAVALARRAYEAGMTFFDTARFYTDSEEKLGEAFDGMREKVCIATKTAAQNAEDFWKDLEVSLHNLRTDYIDIYQFHIFPGKLILLLFLVEQILQLLFLGRNGISLQGSELHHQKQQAGNH